MSRLEPHPLSAMFPPITEDDFNKLIADIKANGLLQPITLYEGKILDGNNRYRACMLAKIEPMTVNFGGPDAQAFVISQNIHRRHLTPEQRRDLIGKLIKADPSKSNRQVADATKTSHHTVGDVRVELETTGQIAQFNSTTGADGRTRSRRTRTTTPSTPAGDYDKLEEKLIKKLKELDPNEARDHADKTISALNDTVEDIQSIAKRAATKAAKLGAVQPQ
jgi:hypothetical protein